MESYTDINSEKENTHDLVKELRHDSTVNAALLLIFWAIYFGIAFLLRFTVKLIGADTTDPFCINAETLAFYILLYPVGFSLILIINKILYRNKRSIKISEYFRKPETPPGWTAKWIFLTIGATYSAALISSLLFTLIEYITKKPLEEADSIPDGSPLSIITIMVAAPVFAPIFEELFFRGTLYRNVRNHGTKSMMLICGIIFGIWHANYPQFLFAAVMGYFSCLLFEKTRSIIPSMIVHFTINLIGSLMCVMVGKAGLTTTDITTAESYELMFEHPFVFLMLTIIGFSMIVFLIIWLVFFVLEKIYQPESFIVEDKHPEISEWKKFWICLSSPLMAVVMAGMIGYTIFRALGGNI